MSDIPLSAHVECTDGAAGQSTGVIINRSTEQVTHFVVKEQSHPHNEYLVPITMVLHTTPTSISLQCTLAELATMDKFMETEFVQVEHPRKYSALSPWPSSLANVVKLIPMVYEFMPEGSLALHNDSDAIATDGHIGRVTELLGDAASGQIDHLLIREGHWWHSKEIIIPITEIDHFREDKVYLKIDRHAAEAMILS